MWVFGYGSLMWDGWENNFACSRRCVAVLQGYRRSFNKKSVKNRGTKESPCPTLNLEKEENGVCEGLAFEFPDDRKGDVFEYLAEREGKDFHLESLTIRLDNDVEVQARVPVYRGKNLISTITLNERASMVRNARGTESSGEDYVREIAELLAKLRIDDPAVTELWQEVQRQRSENK